jgi:uncharacterized protein with HEPN domain
VKDDRLYLLHITECIDRIERYCADGADVFLGDSRTQDAVLRNLQTLAESTQRLSDGLKSAHPEVNWRGLSGFRNVLVHGYLGIDLERAWVIATRDVPELKAHIAQILRNFNAPEDAPAALPTEPAGPRLQGVPIVSSVTIRNPSSRSGRRIGRRGGCSTSSAMRSSPSTTA